MAIVHGMSKCVVELCDRLGLKDNTGLKIDFPLNGAVTLTSTCFASTEDVEVIKEVIEKYDLVARKCEEGKTNV